MDAEQGIQDVIKIISERYAPQKIILFGSRVWGNADADSDLGMLIIKESGQPEVERIREVSRLLRPRPLPLDILVKTPREIRERLAIGDDFLAEILRRGKVVYERAAS